MREQYLAQYQNGFCKDDQWYNAKKVDDLFNSRYCKSLEEAQGWIDKAIKKGQRLATQKHVMGTPPFSIESEPDEMCLVTRTRILKRQVTEWEEA